MTLTNFLVGLPVMLLCLIVQVAVAFWCVRYYVRQIDAASAAARASLAGIRPLLVAMLAMMVGNLRADRAVGGLFVVARRVRASSTTRSTTRR